MIYHSPFSGWTADLSPIAGSAWIWRPRITGESSPADLADYFFSKTLILAGEPSSGTLYVSADDFAAVRVNKQLVGTIGSIVDPSLAGTHTYLTAFDISGYLHPGRNVVTVEAQKRTELFLRPLQPMLVRIESGGRGLRGLRRLRSPAPHQQYGGLELRRSASRKVTTESC